MITDTPNLAVSTAPWGRVLVIDPAAITRISLTCTIALLGRNLIVEAVERQEDSLEAPDLVLLNLKSRRITDEDTRVRVARLREAFAETSIAVISDLDDPHLALLTVHSGFRGYIPTSLDPKLVIAAIQLILTGGVFLPSSAIDLGTSQLGCAHQPPIASEDPDHDRRLTNREREILGQLCSGKPNKIISYELGIAESTVKVHVRSLMRKLGASNRTQIAVRQMGHAIGSGLIPFQTEMRNRIEARTANTVPFS